MKNSYTVLFLLVATFGACQGTNEPGANATPDTVIVDMSQTESILLQMLHEQQDQSTQFNSIESLLSQMLACCNGDTAPPVPVRELVVMEWNNEPPQDYSPNLASTQFGGLERIAGSYNWTDNGAWGLKCIETSEVGDYIEYEILNYTGQMMIGLNVGDAAMSEGWNDLSLAAYFPSALQIIGYSNGGGLGSKTPTYPVTLRFEVTDPTTITMFINGVATTATLTISAGSQIFADVSMANQASKFYSCKIYGIVETGPF